MAAFLLSFSLVPRVFPDYLAAAEKSQEKAWYHNLLRRRPEMVDNFSQECPISLHGWSTWESCTTKTEGNYTPSRRKKKKAGKKKPQECSYLPDLSFENAIVLVWYTMRQSDA